MKSSTLKSLCWPIALASVALLVAGCDDDRTYITPAAKPPVTPPPAAPDVFHVSGTVRGLSPSASVALRLGSGDVLTVSQNGPFTMGTPVAKNGTYGVRIETQPIGETCTVSNATGAGVTGNISNVAVDCSAQSFAINGSFQNPGITSLVLLLNGSNAFDVGAYTTSTNNQQFALPQQLAFNASYVVTIATQPLGYTCSLSGGTGNATTFDPLFVAVNCSANSYTIGGTVTGLANGAQLTLDNNGGDALVVSANGTFTFATPLTAGIPYAATLAARPLGQNCALSNDTGTTGTGNVTNIVVACQAALSVSWDWVAGSSLLYPQFPSYGSLSPVYGSFGAPDPSSTPGGRTKSATWTDAAGNLWLFGGEGTGFGNGNRGDGLGDLWKFTPSTAMWTWVGGETATASNLPPVYGTTGVPSVSNWPGARSGAATWTDASGNFWLLGGCQHTGSSYVCTRLADLWKYNPTSNTWTVVSGDQNPTNGVYGTQGVAAAGNYPSSRQDSVTWTDATGNFWLFGGVGVDSVGGVGYLNDLWKYSPVTSNWTWVSGSSTANAPGVYGTQGTAAAGNIPGARTQASTWVDAAGNLWMFGGYNDVSLGNSAVAFSDFWEFSPSSGNWTWVSGSTVGGVSSTYATIQGVASAGNVPGARWGASAWSDSTGNFWLFAGGNDSDLWQYSPTTGMWTWVGGSTAIQAPGIYGSQGQAALGNSPGSRFNGMGWVDPSGNFWLFGGYGIDSIGCQPCTGTGTANSGIGYLNDVWMVTP